MLPLLIFCAAAMAGEPEPSVEPLGKAAARLGAALGRPLEAERSLAHIPVLIESQGPDPVATVRSLAFSLHASLVLDGSALRIERTPADRKALWAAHVAINRARAAAGLAAWEQTLDELSTGSP